MKYNKYLAIKNAGSKTNNIHENTVIDQNNKEIKSYLTMN